MVVLFLFLMIVNVSAQDLPKVFLLYPENGTVFDRNCAQFTKTELNPNWIRETARRRDEFQAQWDDDGAKYLKVVLSEIGLRFPYREMQGVLTVCPLGLSMSTPLIFDVRRFLSSSPEHSPLWVFAETVFHELMHHYTQAVQGTSGLRKKYGAEGLVTLNHLHVMALEKLALSKLGRQSQLDYLDRRYRTNSPAAYKRAWEIVNDIEGEQTFIKELKAVSPAGPQLP